MSKRGSPSHKYGAGFLAKLVLVFLIYFVLGKLGLSLAFLHPSVSPVWPATGFAMGVMLLLGYRFWPAIFLGAFLVNSTTQGTMITSLLIAGGNTLEGLLGAFFITKFAGGKKVLENSKNIFRFSLIAFAVSIVSATIGVLTLAYSGFVSWNDYSYIWGTWWLGDAIGAIITLPFIIAWNEKPLPKINLETILIFLSTIMVPIFIFTQWSPLASYNYHIEILCVIPILWACFRLRSLGVTLSVIIVSAIAIFGTFTGFGPFAHYSPNEALIFLQIFMGPITLISLTITSLLREKDKRL